MRPTQDEAKAGAATAKAEWQALIDDNDKLKVLGEQQAQAADGRAISAAQKDAIGVTRTAFSRRFVQAKVMEV
ncbi:hypothetical protein V3N99_12330 [Dermatophilaceae bacterium Soc4.6]